MEALMLTAPLQGVLVHERSSGLAGRLAGLLLADQGASVVACRPAGPAADLDLYLDRGKRRLPGAERPAGPATVVIQDGAFGDEQRPPGQIRLAVTSVLPGETDYVLPDDVGDDMLKAVLGFYTDLAVTRRHLGDEVVYTPLPMCSVYAGVLGAIAVAAALAELPRRAAGRDIVMSRMAAGLSALGALLVEVGGLPDHLQPASVVGLPDGLRSHVPQARSDPAHFEWLKRRASPFFACYEAADGRLVMFASLAHRKQARALLEELGAWEALQRSGLVDVSPYDPSNAAFADRNVAVPHDLSLELRLQAADLIEQAVAGRPAAEWERRLSRAGVPCVVVRDYDEWRGLPQTRQAGLTEQVPGCGWLQLGRSARVASAQPYPPLRLASDEHAERSPSAEPAAKERAKPSGAGPLHGLRVLDLANVIAGPACGRVLAELGADVIKVDAVRTDLVPLIATVWPGELSQGKRSILLDLSRDEGRRILHRLAALSDVVVFNKLDPVLAKLGLDRPGLARLNPKAIGVQVSAFKGERAAERDDDPGYDPNLQAVTGIMTRFGSPDAPELHGLASCVDYLAGYLASFGAVVALAAQGRRGDGAGDWADSSLASAASLIQLPFQVDPAPVGDARCLRRMSDGWICVEPQDAPTPEGATVAEAVRAATAAGALAVEVLSLKALKARHRDRPGATIAFRAEGGSYPTLNVRPLWFNFDGAPLPPASAATTPGSDAGTILTELGYSEAEHDALVQEGVVGRPLWAPAD
jgi:crotonobetainyl-CoA:carnitine CoA-transferase CaiB-like acyl-CoA transferase